MVNRRRTSFCSAPSDSRLTPLVSTGCECVKAALAAGMQVVAIESPYVEKEALDGASAYIQDYDELSEFVGQLG